MAEMQFELTMGSSLEVAKLSICKGMKERPFMHMTMKFKLLRWLTHSEGLIYHYAMKVQEELYIALEMT